MRRAAGATDGVTVVVTIVAYTRLGMWIDDQSVTKSDRYRLFLRKQTLIDGAEKSVSCHECDGASKCLAPVPILQFFEIA